MKYIVFLIQNHPYLSGYVASMAVSVISSALPTPGPNDGKGYIFFFNLMHGVAGAVGRIQQVRGFMGLQENPTTLAGIAAKEDAQVIDPTVQGTSQKPEDKK
jgi:hypothetical protein